MVTNSCEQLTTSLIVHSDNNLKVGFNGREEGREGIGGEGELQWKLLTDSFLDLFLPKYVS